jgi:hypothetical protein
MSTGNIETWAGEIAEIGPAYPFVGSEVFLVIACVIFVLWFLVKQSRIESAGIADELRQHGGKESLAKLVDQEDPKNP